MAPKLKLRLAPPPPPPRNSFTMTDYYRTTREEIYSPISRVESFGPDSPYSPYADLPDGWPTRLAHIHDDSSDEGAADGGAQQRVRKRAIVFWHVFHTVFRNWRRQKARASISKAAHL